MKINNRLNGRERIFVLIIIVLLGVIAVMWYSTQPKDEMGAGQMRAPAITVSTPTKGQQICANSTLTITWQVPSDMDAVDIYLQKGNTSYPIEMGALANPINGKGGSPYTYKLNGKYAPADNYKVDLGGTYTGGRLNASSEYFSIVKCDSSGTPLPDTPTGIL